MNLRKLAATALLAVTILFGFATFAGAAQAEAPAPGQNQGHPSADQCQRLHRVYERAKEINSRIKDAAHKLLELRARAEAAGKTELVQKIDERLAKARQVHDRLVQRIKNLHDRIGNQCQEQAPELEPVA